VATKQLKNKYQFLVKHYAGDVVYNSEHLIEKNRNEVVQEFQDCLRSSSLTFLQNLTSFLDPDDVGRGAISRMYSPSSPGKPQRFNGSPSRSPMRTPSKSTLLTPNKPKISFLEPEKAPTTPSTSTSAADGTLQRATTSVTSTPTPTPLKRSNSSYLGIATRGPQRTGASPKLQSIKKKSTLLISFTKQLQQLMDSIRTTRSHFIRCIKPNSSMSSCEYNHRLVMSQLRCGGVLGAIQVFRAGFPNRFQFSVFVERYSILAYVIGAKQNPLTRDFYLLKRKAIENNLETFYWKRCCDVLMRLVPLAQVSLDAIGIPEKGHEMTSRTTSITPLELLHSSSAYFSQERAEKGQEMSIGKKQIFLRASYYEYLESLLYRANAMVARIVQYNWRYKSHQYLKSLQLSSAKVLMVHHLVHLFSVQSSRARTKGFFAQLLTIQRRFRVYYQSRRFRLARYLSTWLSSHFRGYQARASVRTIRHAMARRIQMSWRGFVARRRYHAGRASAILLQRWYRSLRLRLMEAREGERYRRGVVTVTSLQAMWRGATVRAQFQVLLLEKVSSLSSLPPSPSHSFSRSSPPSWTFRWRGEKLCSCCSRSTANTSQTRGTSTTSRPISLVEQAQAMETTQ
jgi:hypothetical protein